MEKTVNALGRRKSAVARVYVVAGTGKFTVNGREVNDYFVDETYQYIVNQPFTVTGTTGQFDVKANLCGGGIKGLSPAHFARLTARLTAQHSRPKDSSPATQEKSRGKSLVSLVHVAASSSASVNACLLLIYSHSPVDKSSDLVRGVSSDRAA